VIPGVWGGEIKVTIREIRPNNPASYDEGDLGAELYVDVGGGLVYGGPGTKRTATNGYFVPLTRGTNPEHCSLYYMHYTPEHVHGFSIRIDHINPHTAVVSFVWSRIEGFKSDASI
jgi:hypothetical protein